MVAAKSSRIVDVHHHLCSSAYVDVVSRKTSLRPFQLRTLRNGSPEKSLEDMDRAGVRMSMISLTTPGVWFGDAAEACRLARETNEYFARVVADHPGRYGMFAVLPLPDIDGSLKEIDYALDTLKADGIAFYTSYRNTHLGDAAFAPIFAELHRRKAFAYTHPCRPDCCLPMLPEITEAAIEYGTDTTRTIASLVFSGTAARFSDVKYHFSHCGGTMPFLIRRFLALAKMPELAERVPEGVMPLLRKFYYDTAQATSPGPIAALMQLISISQLLFGTDFPYGGAAEQLAELEDCGLSKDDLASVVSGNAAAVLPRCAG